MHKERWEAVERELTKIGFSFAPVLPQLRGPLNWRETLAMARVDAHRDGRRYRVSGYQNDGTWYWRSAPVPVEGELFPTGTWSMTMPDPGPEVRAIMFGGVPDGQES